MAGGGFANHAMQVVKANRALLNKRKRLTREDYIGTKSETHIKIKKATPGQLRAVQLQIAANKRRELRVWVFSLFLFVVLLLGCYYLIVH